MEKKEIEEDDHWVIYKKFINEFIKKFIKKYIPLIECIIKDINAKNNNVSQMIQSNEKFVKSLIQSLIKLNKIIQNIDETEYV